MRERCRRDGIPINLQLDARARPPEASLGATVLLVDDRRTAVETLTARLIREGCRVLAAANARTAVDAFIRERADLLIIDQDLADRDGADLLRRLRALDGAVPIILQSSALGSAQQRHLIRARDLHGIHDRNGDVEHLLELVESALAGRRRLESARAAEELRSLALAKFCHELRGCLHVIRGYTEMLRDDPATAAVTQILGPLSVASDTALGLAQHYLDLAHLDAPGVIVRRELVDVDALLADLRGLAGRQIGHRPLRLSTQVPVVGSFVYTDGEKLRAILAQLLANAIKFSESGEIRLSVELQPRCTDFIVVDRGPGIDQAEVGRAFSPFCQSSAESVASTPGQGLGLAIARRLSALIGASLSASSARHGGAIFTLSLPETIGLCREALKPTLH